MKKINVVLIASAMLWGMISCQSKNEEAAIKVPETPVVTTPPEKPKPEVPALPEEYSSQEGLQPSSIEDIVDVFELKYGEVKGCVYNGKAFKFSIAAISDSLACLCGQTEEYTTEAFDKSKIHAYLTIDTGNDTARIKVSSGWHRPIVYNNDGTDVKGVREMLEIKLPDPAYNFLRIYGNGARLTNTTLSIFMAKADPFAYKLIYSGIKAENGMYKFIFVITNSK